MHEKLDFGKLKHIFSQALLGFIQQHATERFKQDFAFRYFLKGSENSLPKTHKVNEIQILKAKAEQVLKERITFRHGEKNDNDRILYFTQVVLSSGITIGEHESVSKTYAKKKAVKNAVRYVMGKEAETPEFQRFAEKKQISDNEKALQEKAERQKQHDAFITKKGEKRIRVRMEKKVLAKEREYQRLLNKKITRVEQKNNCPKRQNFERVERS